MRVFFVHSAAVSNKQEGSVAMQMSNERGTSEKVIAVRKSAKKIEANLKASLRYNLKR